MPKRFLRGDAPAAAQVWRLKQPLITGAVTLRVGNKSLEFDTWDAAEIVAAWNASKWPEMRSATAATSGADVVFTARTPGVPFFIWVTVGSTAQGEGAGRNEVHYVALVNSPDGGTFNWSQLGDDVDIDFDATGSELQSALESLDGFAPGDVTATGPDGGPWTVEYTGRYAGQDVPLPVLDGTNLTGGDAAALIRTIQDGGAGGTGNFSPEADQMSYLQDNDTGSDYFEANSLYLRVGRADGSTTQPFWSHSIIRFTLDLPRGQSVTAAELQLVLTGRDGYGGAIAGTVFAEAADDPTVPAHAADALGRPLVSPGVNFTVSSSLAVGNPFTIEGLATLIQALVDRPGWVAGNPINLHLRATAAGNATVYFNHSAAYGGEPPVLSVDYDGDLREIQGVSLSGNPRAGNVTLTLEDQTADPLDYNATAAEAQAAIEALSNVGTANVTCSGGPWPAEIICSFDATLGNLPQMTATDTLSNGDVSISTSQQGGPDVQIVEEQRSRGPNHADDPLNWENDTGAFAVPEKDCAVYCRDGKVDLLYGLKWRSTFTVNTTTDRLLFGEQQLALWDGQAVEVLNDGGALPTGLAANTTYYIRDLAYPFCRLATSPGGPPVNITTTGTGTHTLGVRLSLLHTDSRYTGKLGLPRNNRDGYAEYRPRFLEAWIDVAKIGVGNGSGAARCHLHTGSQPLTYQQHKASGGTDNAPAAQLLCAGSGNTIEVLAGELGIAIDPDQAAEFETLKVRAGSVLLGQNVAAGSIERTGGAVQSLGATVDGTVHL
jgi:hypothetical protein